MRTAAEGEEIGQPPGQHRTADQQPLPRFADELAGKLKSLGYAPRVEVTSLPDKGKWFRVIMNGFQTREDAQKAADKISRSIKGLNCVVRSSESGAHP